MKTLGTIILIYALLIFAGGIFGFVKADSYQSLIASIIFGVLLFLSSVFIYRNQRSSIYFAIILVLVLDAFFAYRFIGSYKFMPAGLMLIISSIALICLFIQFIRIRRS